MAVGRGFRIAEGYLEVTADHSKADREMDGFFRDVNGRLHDQQGRFAKEGQIAGERYAEELDHAAERKERQSFGGLAARFGKRFLAIGGMAGKLFANGFVLKAVAGLAALPTAISATGAIAQGLFQMGGAIAALAPAAIGGAIFSLISLKLALSGFGDALKAGLSGDTEKFAQALKKLAPAAQEAVKQFVALAPAARELKRVVQNSFFAPWLDDIKPLATTYLPILRAEMAYLAGSAGVAVHQVAALFTPPDAAQAFQAMLHDFAKTFSNIASAIPGLVSGFFNLAGAGSKWLSRLSGGLSDLANKFSAWSAEFVDSGRFDAFVSHGLSMIGQLKDALADVVGIVRKVFAAVPGGGGLFVALGQLTDGLNRFLETTEGQQALTGFFARLQALAGLIMGLVKNALPGLLALSDATLTAFQILAPVAGTVGGAIGDALKALAPLLPLIASALAPLLNLAAAVLQALAAELGPVIKLFSELATGILPILMPLIDQMANTGLPLAAAAGQALYEAFAPVIPVLLDVYKTLADALMPILPQITQVMMELIPVITEVAKIFADTWISVLKDLQPHLPTLVRLLGALILTFAEIVVVLAKVLPYVATFASWFIKAGGWVAGFVLSIIELPRKLAEVGLAFWNWIKSIGPAVGNFFLQIGQWFAALPGQIAGFIQQIPTMISNALSAAFDAFFYWLGYITASVIQFATNLPNQIGNMITSIGQWFSELPTRALLWFSQMYNTISTWVANTYHSIVQWLSGVGPAIGNWFSDAWTRAKNATVNGVSAVIYWVKSLPGTIKGALSDAIHWLEGAGSDVLHGLINGFTGALDWAKGMIDRAMKKLVDGAKAALHISSPSKLWAAEVGAPSAQGIGAGFAKAMPDVQRVINAQVAAMPGRTAATSVNVAAPNVSVGGPTVMVLLDGEEISAKVVTPKRVNQAGTEGARRRAFLDTGRTAAA
jgi:phage-related protein